ncbi:PREDICTED: agamous-like MADS-box protein AGL97 isoform X2 [Brassica oleracea var. oleracea]|uniref:agamous-like MADS-box protein AGL97 isoform X2 n=1 Tax=Brassica oleracea var. oleracea TaxID=109376 RepID=UPI0006A73052|nr:PREDICTED: agamous-like MADS-box protein AGL97 isoform X2 [Brassica oleracea var. oleracea]
MVKSEKKAKVERKKRKPSRPAANISDLRSSVEKKKGFAELRDDLFREAAKLVAEDPSQRIAILIKPPASESSVAMQSFGYPSAEGVVRQFLKDSAPHVEDEDWSKYYWWEDEKLLNSKDPVEIMAAMEEMKKLQKQLEHFVPRETGQGSGTQDDGSKP